MRKILLAFIILPGVSSTAWAKPLDFGLGFVVGDTIGGTGKLWIDKYSAIDAAVGQGTSQGNFVFYADYLYHGWKAFPQPKSGRLAAYVGGGPRVESITNDTEVGVRAVAGASYWLNKNPFEFFAELGPMFRMKPTGGAYVIGGFGVRYYFKGWN